MGFSLHCGIYFWDSVVYFYYSGLRLWQTKEKKITCRARRSRWILKQTEVLRIYASASSSSPIQSVKSSDRSPSLQTKPCSSPSLSPSTPLFSPCPSTAFSFGRTRLRCLRLVTSCVASVQSTVANGSAPAPAVVVEREQIRLGLPSKGRMAADSIDLLKVNGVSVPMKICILIIIWLML